MPNGERYLESCADWRIDSVTKCFWLPLLRPVNEFALMPSLKGALRAMK